VGFGNSGGEIAIDLCEHGAQVGLAVRSPVNVIPRDLLGIPILSIGIAMGILPPRLADALSAPMIRLAMGDLTRYGLRKLPYGPITQITEQGRIPLLDIGTIKLIKQGKIVVHPGIERFTAVGVLFVDGTQANFDAVVLATGYRPQVAEFLQTANVLNEEGTPQSSGVQSSETGLYFCGFYISPTGMLREIGLEAVEISQEIAK
jgi:cation diffusion facilitator CzcD-associated flavoprotein CzcO